jgi:oligo-1,6-glucosidase
MKGTPYYYYGDEIGIKFDNVEDYRDIETLAEYERLQNTGGDLIHRRPENGWRER